MSKPTKKRKLVQRKLTATALFPATRPSPEVTTTNSAYSDPITSDPISLDDDPIEDDVAVPEGDDGFEWYNAMSWEGFKRSKTHTSRHYRAKCSHCLKELARANPDKLRDHRNVCTKWPRDLNRQQSQPPRQVSANNRIIELFMETEMSQEDSDYLLTMAIITGDISYRYVSCI